MYIAAYQQFETAPICFVQLGGLSAFPSYLKLVLPAYVKSGSRRWRKSFALTALLERWRTPPLPSSVQHMVCTIDNIPSRTCTEFALQDQPHEWRCCQFTKVSPLAGRSTTRTRVHMRVGLSSCAFSARTVAVPDRISISYFKRITKFAVIGAAHM